MPCVKGRMAGKAEEGFEMLRIFLITIGPDNITINTARKDARIEEKSKQRSWKKPRDTSLRRAIL